MSRRRWPLSPERPLSVHTVQILLATYNGGDFLQELLDSLFGQTSQDFEILVADDGSSDNTVSILSAYCETHPGRIRILYRSRVGGAAQNFMRLVRGFDAPYAMFCDQDDVWHAHKIARMLAKMRQRESELPDMPILLHSDLTVVDDAMREIDGSFVAYQGIDTSRDTFAELLCANCVTGCATFLNRALLAILKQAPSASMEMHDWWAALTAAAFGKIYFVPEPLTLYRQHRRNMQGASEWGFVFFIGRAAKVLAGGPIRRHVLRWSRQAGEFLRVYGHQLSPDQKLSAQRVAALTSLGPFARRAALVRYGLLRSGFWRNLTTLLIA